MKFKTILFQAGKTATGIRIPARIVEALGKGKKPPILVTINGYTYRNTVAVMGGEYLVGVSADHRKGANIKGGETIEVNIELDTQAREVEIPLLLQKALNKNSIAGKNFSALAYSKKKAIVVNIQSAKTDETRDRRIEKVVEMLQEGKA